MGCMLCFRLLLVTDTRCLFLWNLKRCSMEPGVQTNTVVLSVAMCMTLAYPRRNRSSGPLILPSDWNIPHQKETWTGRAENAGFTFSVIGQPSVGLQCSLLWPPWCCTKMEPATTGCQAFKKRGGSSFPVVKLPVFILPGTGTPPIQEGEAVIYWLLGLSHVVLASCCIPLTGTSVNPALVVFQALFQGIAKSQFVVVLSLFLWGFALCGGGILLNREEITCL